MLCSDQTWSYQFGLIWLFALAQKPTIRDSKSQPTYPSSGPGHVVCALEQGPGEETHTVAKAVVGLSSQGILGPDLERKEEEVHSLEKMTPGRHALDPAHSWSYGKKQLKKGKTPEPSQALRQNPSSLGLGAEVSNAVDGGTHDLCSVSTLTAWFLHVYICFS